MEISKLTKQRICNMKAFCNVKVFVTLILSMLAIASCQSPNSCPDLPDPNAHTFKAEFKATPDAFSAQGGEGLVSGVLKEINAEGVEVSERPLTKSEFTLRLKSGDANQISIDNDTKKFVVVKGSTATFELEAMATVEKATKNSQVLTIVRGGEVNYSFVATPAVFTAMGGVGTVSGLCKITNASGEIVSEKALEPSDFTLSLKAENKEITVDDATKSFNVAMGNDATFELIASCDGEESQVLTISRKGKLTYKFKAEPSTFDAAGGKGFVAGICTAVDQAGSPQISTSLASEDFTISLKSGNKAEIVIDQAEKSFLVKAGEKEADFILEAKALHKDATPQEIKIHREAKATPAPTNRLPLEYVAEYNIDPSGTGFVKTHATNESGYFTFEDAVAKFSDITIAGKKYHLPSHEELMSIVPSFSMNLGSNFAIPTIVKDASETVTIKGRTVSSKNDYRGGISGVAYAVRFKGTDFVSAWKYECTRLDNHLVMKVTARPLKGANASIIIDDVAKPSFWTSSTEHDVVRYFPASGLIKPGSESVLERDVMGYFWASDSYDSTNSWGCFFNQMSSFVAMSKQEFKLTIRLFETN